MPIRSPALTPFQTLRQAEEEHVRDIAYEDPGELIRGSLLSPNAKCSVSLDFPIGHTCSPTPLCAQVCYASRSGTPARWPKSLRKRLRNLRFVLETPTAKVVDRMVIDFRRAKAYWKGRGVELDWLRINGTGDLFPALIPVLNAFMARRPATKLWVVTRQLELAAQLTPRDNLYLQLSLDRSTTPEQLRAAKALVASNPRAYLSFLRTAPDDDTRGAAIVFNEKRTEGLPFKSKTDCPADAGAIPLNNVRGKGGTACADCRKCFTDRTLERQREAA